jgi:putative hydrolase of the HAD superfamily/pyrimidine and pyridine-specific 5'-nucleotidase
MQPPANAAMAPPTKAAPAPPAPPAVLFLDCDDCLYQNNWATAQKITASIATYTARLGVSQERAYSLYKQYGTCLRGMMAEGLVDAVGVEEFLHEVHQIDYSDICADQPLAEMLSRLRIPAFVFTASTREHASRCLQRLGLDQLPLRGIIDCRTCELETKHSRSSFEIAMKLAGVTDPSACVFCDDSTRNVIAAKELGWRTVLVGLKDRDTGVPVTCDAADVAIDSLHHLATAMPELFHSVTPEA